MNSISKINVDFDLIENSTPPICPWKNHEKLIDSHIELAEKNIVRENHLKSIKHISREKNTAIFYINGAYNQKSKIASASVILYQNSKTSSKSWNLGIGMKINNAETYAIEKAIKWASELTKL